MSARAGVGVIGLAVMGSNLARNLARNGHTVALWNRTTERTTALVAAHGPSGRNAAGSSTKLASA